MWLITLTLLAVAFELGYLWLRSHYAYWAKRNVPHETPSLFLGNMKGIGARYHLRDINRRIYVRFKGLAPFVGFYSFLSKTAFLLDLELIKHVLIKDFATFANRGLFHNVRDDPLTGNLLFLDGEQWRVLRHKLSPVFTSGKMRYMFPTLVAIGEHLAEVYGALADSTGDCEAKDLCARYTTDVIGSVAFGLECNSLSNPQAQFRRMGQAIFEQPRHSLPVQTFMFTNPELARKLRLKAFTDEASAFFMNAVRQTVKYRQRSGIKRNDFMDMLVELKEQRDALSAKQERHVDDLSNGLTLEQVAAQALVFFLAGFDTSSTTMAFCLYELALNPLIQQQLRNEICTVLARHKSQLTYECIKEMTYLQQVISETLRKYSVLPHIVRQSVAAYKVPNTNFTLDKGMRIFIPVDAIHHDPKYYPNPEKFDPERFTARAIQQRHPCAYLPFGDGPRNCIGSRFGKMQTSIGIISLLRQYHFSPNERTQLPLPLSRKTFLLAVEGGIHLTVKRI